MKIAVAGTGYVGLSNAVLLAQNNEVIAVDVVSKKVEMINSRKSPIIDKEIEEYKVENDELKDLTNIAEEKARIAEQMSSKFQNDAYRVQLEKIEIENELKFYKATR